MKIDDRLEKLKQFDTPSITNVVATYPDKEYCLGLYHPWRGQWYTDERKGYVSRARQNRWLCGYVYLWSSGSEL